MLVKAKCVTRAWDSEATVMYEPGLGPLPGGLYEIDRDGPLAHMKLGSTYVFDFDRNCGPDDKPHDYSCKREGCGKKFKTLAALGTHTKTEHKDDPNPLAEPDAEVVIVQKSTCKQCNPPQVFDSRGEMMKHKGEVHGAAFFQKGFGKQKVEAEAIPA